MKNFRSVLISLFITGALLFSLSSAASAQPQTCGSIVLGDSCVVAEGQSIDGDMVVFGGMVTLEAGATINGDLALTGGSLDAYGTLNGDLVSTGGFVHLHETAVVNGDITRIGGNLVQDAGAVVDGNIITTSNSGVQIPEDGFDFSRMRDAFRPIRNFFGAIFQALAFAIIAIIVVLVAPKGTERLARTASSKFALCLGMGALGFLVVLLGSLMFTITIIGIPLAILILFAFSVTMVYGWIGLGQELGNRMAKLFKTSWNAAIATGLGTLALSLAAALVGWIPCLGWLAVVLVAVTGFGSVVLTRFGTRLPDDVPPFQPPSVYGSVNPVVPAPGTQVETGSPDGNPALDEEAIKKMVSDASDWTPEPTEHEDPLPPVG